MCNNRRYKYGYAGAVLLENQDFTVVPYVYLPRIRRSGGVNWISAEAEVRLVLTALRHG